MLSIPVIAMASTSLYAGLYHLLIYARSRHFRAHLTFSILCFTVVAYDAFCVGLYNSTSAVEGAYWQRLQFLALALFVPAFLWFGTDYTNQKPGRAIYIFSAFYCVAFLVQLVDRSSLTFLVDQPSIKDMSFLGVSVTYHEVALGPFSSVQGVAGLIASIPVLVMGVRYFKSGHRGEAASLLLATGLMYLAGFNDVLIGIGVYHFVYLMEYAYLATVLMMAYSLSNTVVDAAVTKEELRKSEEWFRSLVETTSDWVWEVDKNGRYTYASPRVRDLLGYEPEEILGRTPFEFMSPEEANSMGIVFQTIIQNRGVFERVENNNLRKDGQLVVLETSGIPFFSENGDLLGYRGIDRDVTERKQSEEALRRNQEMLRTVLDQFPGVVFWKDVQLVYMGCNQAFAMASGLSNPAEIVGKTDFDLPWAKTEAMAFRCNDRAVIESGQPRHDILEPQHQADGRLAWFDTVKVPLMDGKGNVIGVLGASRDITEQKQTEDRLRISEERLQQAIRISDIGIFDHDQTVDSVYWSPEVRRDFGIRLDEPFTLADFTHCLHPDDLDRVGQEIQQAHDPSGDGSFDVEYRFIRRDNSLRWFTAKSRTFFAGEGESKHPVRTIGALIDITKSKQYEEERESLIKELEAKNAELERFTYTVSHDLKSPLVTIKGFLGFLERDFASRNEARFLGDIERISNATARMDLLLRDLLELSRIGRLINPSENVSFDALVSEAMQVVHGQLETRGVRVQIHPNLPAVFVDRRRLVETIQNLLDNATKFMGDQPFPCIEIGQQGEDGDMHIFFVKDNGVGFAPEYGDHIFGLFNKLDPKTEGSGIGLALVKRIIEVHGGKVWVESEKGKGTTFYFSLPKGDGGS
jgi:PAS domain S-box-containing protein